MKEKQSNISVSKDDLESLVVIADKLFNQFDNENVIRSKKDIRACIAGFIDSDPDHYEARIARRYRPILFDIMVKRMEERTC